ncbi:uncharacterized protein LACBIDRAFT_303348 [Laccaria bicolor S238N-H82]|uniref:Predicted protein n=1 Tax=Laccaria bicolor (strain S238N-H82 / ATCC MYA-4686) TaxID=486041 RepID=B0DJC9_LACBS|nr:uncharacterized protein LACBIDRAFT_303348 [Laccaria bicolor S238N-H82]EDR05385.1 predicted protein [Laccaria bicolor S238N-H82]|eukprot:XP_001883943.1 predicted protein [Laccaria bicolor S238N-H82]
MPPRMFLDYVHVPPRVHGASNQRLPTTSDKQLRTQVRPQRGTRNHTEALFSDCVLEDSEESDSFSPIGISEDHSDSSDIHLPARIHGKRKGTAAKPEEGTTSSKRQKKTGRVVLPTPIIVPPGASSSNKHNLALDAASAFTFKFLDTHTCDCATLPVNHPQKQCNVLRYFDLYYSSSLNAIICYKHGCFVLMERWFSHLQLVNRDGSHAHKCTDPKARKKAELTAMKAHVEASFHPAVSESDNALVLPSHLQDILPMAILYEGERPPILARYPCPVSGCSAWVAISKNKTSGYEHDLNKHVVKVHCSKLTNYPQRSKMPIWTQRLKLGQSTYHVFQLPSGWSPPTQAPSYPLPTISHLTQLSQQNLLPPPPPLPPQASWMHDLGWSSYRATMPWTDAFLRRALEPPSLSLASQTRGSLKWLELGLNVISDTPPRYLANANLYLDHCHPLVRVAINSGSKLGAFRPLTANRYKQYGAFLTQAVSMILRMVHEKIVLQEKQSGGILPCTQTQLEAAVGLYRVIMEGMGTYEEDKLLPSLHTFLDSLLRSGEMPTQLMSFPTDLLLFFSSIRPDGAYSMATIVTSNCAALRYCLLAIFTHVSRCSATGLKDFAWFEKPKPSSPSDSSVEGEKGPDADGTDYISEQALGCESEGAAEEELFDSQASQDDSIEEEDIEAVLERIMDDTYESVTAIPSRPEVEVDKDGHSELPQDDGDLGLIYEKIESYLQNTIPGASRGCHDGEVDMETKSESPLSFIHQEIGWVTSRDELERSTPFSRIHRVWGKLHGTTLDQPGSLHFSSLGDGFTWDFQRHQQEPRSVDMRKWALACRLAMDGFQASVKWLSLESKEIHSIKIEDNKLRDAPHRQTSNLERTTVAQRDIFSRILANATDKGGDVGQHLKSWLAEEQKAIEFLAIILCLAGGVSFRGWQLSPILFDCSGDRDRNLWIVDGYVLVSHPKAKQRTQKQAPTFLAFPSAISSDIACYIAIIRPTACMVLKHLEIDDPHHSVVLWSDPIPPVPKISRRCPIISWSGQDISHRLQKFTMREIGTPISPMLARQISQAVIRDKFPRLFDDHVLSSPLIEYAHRCRFPHWQDMGPEVAVQILAVSQMWQALLNLESSTNQPWLSVVENCRIFPSEMVKNWEAAFFKATRVIDKAGVRGLLSLWSNKELLNSQESLSDLIVPVLGHLLFGLESRPVDIDLPLWGLHSRSVARVLQMIRLAADSTCKASLSDIKTHLTSENAKSIYQSALKDVEDFKHSNVCRWDKLSREVYLLHRHSCITPADTLEKPSSLSSVIHLISGLA